MLLRDFPRPSALQKDLTKFIQKQNVVAAIDLSRFSLS
jgi:hypothetical protein